MRSGRANNGAPVLPPIRWRFDPSNPVIRPGQVNGELDATHAGAGHVLQLGDRYRMYYWAKGSDARNRICVAESSIEQPNDWRPLGSALERQPGSEYNDGGPSFPFVLPADGGPWLLYFGAWGKPRRDGKLPNTTGLAVASDGRDGAWRYVSDRPILPLNTPCDCEGTGSVWVLWEGGTFRMYYTAIGRYFHRPEGVTTGHGEIIPRIGIGYAVSKDGVHWQKPLDRLAVAPRGFDVAPYEYIVSKPCVLREPGGYRMFVNTFGTAYRVRSLSSDDGLRWRWHRSGPEGEMGVGTPGAFDDHQRCYASVVKQGDEYRCWYSGNGFGATGMGFAVGEIAHE